MSDRGWIGVDLDGTIAHYDHGKFDPKRIGAPIPLMVERVKRWLAEGYDVRIFTARVSRCNLTQRIDIEDAIGNWCVEHVGQWLRTTNVKDYDMLELWDDRAVQVEANTGRLIGQSTRGL